MNASGIRRMEAEFIAIVSKLNRDDITLAEVREVLAREEKRVAALPWAPDMLKDIFYDHFLTASPPQIARRESGEFGGILGKQFLCNSPRAVPK